MIWTKKLINLRKRNVLKTLKILWVQSHHERKIHFKSIKNKKNLRENRNLHKQKKKNKSNWPKKKLLKMLKKLKFMQLIKLKNKNNNQLKKLKETLMKEWKDLILWMTFYHKLQANNNQLQSKRLKFLIILLKIKLI